MCYEGLIKDLIADGDSLGYTLFNNLNLSITPCPITCSSVIHKTSLHPSGGWGLLVIAPVLTGGITTAALRAEQRANKRMSIAHLPPFKSVENISVKRQTQSTIAEHLLC